MIDYDSLNVWHEKLLVGYLWRNQQGFIGFRYSEGWIEANGFPVSLRMPVADEAYPAEDDSLAHRFFANLLPEGGIRDWIVQERKIADTDFDLLRVIGGECAGALSILPVEREPDTDHEYTELSAEELSRLIRSGGRIQFTGSENEFRPRLSLAGAQNKCPVLLCDNRYYLPLRESPTSHILKFEVRDYRHLPVYEAFTTRLAKASGLPTVAIDLSKLDDDHYTCIRRYDRVYNKKGRLMRLHQEDLCQALGYGYNRKYQKDNGPAFSDCYNLIRDYTTEPAIDGRNLLLWLIFNYLAGNSDGHAKNLALLYESDGSIRLAPFYDLICTRAVEHIDVNLAFAIGGQANPGHITADHWQRLAGECDVGHRFLESLLRDTADRLLANLPLVKESFEHDCGEYPALQRIEQMVTAQCRRALQS